MITIKHIDNTNYNHTTNIEVTSLINRLLYSHFYISVAPLDMRVLRSSDKVITSIMVEVPLPEMYDKYMMTRMTQVFKDEFSQEKYQNDRNEFIHVKFIF